VAFRLAPLSLAEAGRAIDEVASLRSLGGAAREAIAAAMVRFGAWAATDPSLVSVDVNPVAVLDDGSVCALDALVIMAD
jgi:hypothetical protein